MKKLTIIAITLLVTIISCKKEKVNFEQQNLESNTYLKTEQWQKNKMPLDTPYLPKTTTVIIADTPYLPQTNTIIADTPYLRK